MLHQGLGAGFADRVRQQLHQVGWGADATELRMDEFKQTRRRAPALGRGRQNHRITALEGVDDFVGWCSRRVGGRRDSANHPHRPRDFGQAQRSVFVNHAHRARALQVAQQAQCFTVVFSHFVRHIANAGVGHSPFSKLLVSPRLKNRPAGCRHHFVHAALVIAIGHLLCQAGAGHELAHQLIQRAVCWAHVNRP